MGNENEGKTLTLKELFYIIKRHVVLETIIVILGIFVGVMLALTNKDVYIASWRVSVKANIKQDISYNDTSLSKTIMPTIEDFISNDSVFLGKECVGNTAYYHYDVCLGKVQNSSRLIDTINQNMKNHFEQ